MRGRTVCFTSFAAGYTPRARILARTLADAHPSWRRIALLVERAGQPSDLEGLDAFHGVIRARDLPIPRFDAWMFKHDVVEGCTAVKGRMLVELLDAGADTVIYLDPDIAVFHPLKPIERALDRASVVLTPHQTSPNETAAAIGDNEGTSMRYGVYNLGFLAVRNDADGRAFARWWAACLERACYDEVERGLFTDQKYCDLAPALFDGIHIERDPGCNVASWNLSRRRVTIGADGGIQAGGAPLRFYHFTKIGGAGDVMTDRYGADSPDVFELWSWYKRELASLTPSGPSPAWSYAAYTDGTPIPKAARTLYRGRPDLMEHFDDPFATGEGTLHAWFETHAPQVLLPGA